MRSAQRRRVRHAGGMKTNQPLNFGRLVAPHAGTQLGESAGCPRAVGRANSDNPRAVGRARRVYPRAVGRGLSGRLVAQTYSTPIDSLPVVGGLGCGRADGHVDSRAGRAWRPGGPPALPGPGSSCLCGTESGPCGGVLGRTTRVPAGLRAALARGQPGRGDILIVGRGFDEDDAPVEVERQGVDEDGEAGTAVVRKGNSDAGPARLALRRGVFDGVGDQDGIVSLSRST